MALAAQRLKFDYVGNGEVDDLVNSMCSARTRFYVGMKTSAGFRTRVPRMSVRVALITMVAPAVLPFIPLTGQFIY